MMFARMKRGAVARGIGRVLPALLVSIVLSLAVAWHHSALAGEPTEAKGKVAGEPSFDLPPIVVQISQTGRPYPRAMVFKAALIFDETDEQRINDSQRIAKTLMPKIMDSVITGVQAHQFSAASNVDDVNQVILDRSVAVLQPYGVVIKTLRIEQLGIR
jgi:hypothetical protein